MNRLCTLAVSAMTLIGGPVIAGEKHAAKRAEKQGNPVYPKFEKQYERRYTQPTLNCGACFGYYKTNWTSWAEACGQPEPIYSAAPQQTPKAADPKVDEPKVPDSKPMEPNVPDPKPIDPKPTELKPKVPEVAPTPMKTPDPVPLPTPKPIDPKKPGESGKSSLHTPPAATTVSITIPAVESEIPSIPLIPAIPAVNVK